ncbi:winged helix-turn-helix domain-containing protein [bacterium]|nr:winged helix-turn-helix domain-containing protein [bacterium]
MQESIIETAGMIWEYLNQNGEVTMKKMNKDLSLNENMMNMGLGWLSREDKLNFSKKGSYTKVSLR